jgi:hypothetical protein
MMLNIVALILFIISTIILVIFILLSFPLGNYPIWAVVAVIFLGSIALMEFVISKRQESKSFIEKRETMLRTFASVAISLSSVIVLLTAFSMFEPSLLVVVFSSLFFLGGFMLLTVVLGKKKTHKPPIASYVALALLTILTIGVFATPSAVQVVTGQYGKSTAEQNALVNSILGDGEQGRERFELYFHWHNVLHEIGHIIVGYNGANGLGYDGSALHPVEQEQLVNDFAVAFRKYYGEPEKQAELESTVVFALGNLTRPAGSENQTAIEYGKDNWGQASLMLDFNNYGWLQFSLVDSSLQNTKTLESVLAEMGVKNITVQPQKIIAYQSLGEDVVSQIIIDAVTELRKWGAEIPTVYHKFDKNPNNHMAKMQKNYFGRMQGGM